MGSQLCHGFWKPIQNYLTTDGLTKTHRKQTRQKRRGGHFCSRECVWARLFMAWMNDGENSHNDSAGNSTVWTRDRPDSYSHRVDLSPLTSSFIWQFVHFSGCIISFSMFPSQKDVQHHVCSKSVQEKKPFKVVRSDAELYVVCCPIDKCNLSMCFAKEIKPWPPQLWHWERAFH